MFGGGDMRVINTTYYNDTLSITIPAFHPEETNKEMLSKFIDVEDSIKTYTELLIQTSKWHKRLE